jgi:EAL domain-containing protein (putative c-di-GMP-specific phosphodiesterase class I)
MRVTFEGIETTEQLDRARALGVPAEGQGWLFGKPVAVGELDRIFEMETEQAVA